MKKAFLLLLFLGLCCIFGHCASAGAEEEAARWEYDSVFRGLKWGQSLESVLLTEIRNNELGDRPLIDFDRSFPEHMALIYTPFGSGPDMPFRISYYFSLDPYTPTDTALKDAIVSLRVPLGPEDAERNGRIIGLDLRPCKDAAECLKMASHAISAKHNLKPEMCDGEPTWDVNGDNYINAKVANVKSTTAFAQVPGIWVMIYYSFWPIGGGCSPAQ
ncbi:hypothetical protein LJB86_03960 [Deltaproteobacteria bacterium OttesenSCG-928-M10]|nr:hypothetical protein [Deltaproteobacteria bacterium OttesenSCG-928-M10]